MTYVMCGKQYNDGSWNMIFFASGVGFPLHPEIFYFITHNDSAAHQDRCRRCRILTRDLCPWSLVSYQWATTSPISHHISREPPHLPESHHISSEPQHLQWATTSPSEPLHLQWATTSPSEPPHLQWATTSPSEPPHLPVSHHISWNIPGTLYINQRRTAKNGVQEVLEIIKYDVRDVWELYKMTFMKCGKQINMTHAWCVVNRAGNTHSYSHS